MSDKIQGLLKLAETSSDGKSSVSCAHREFESAGKAEEIFARLKKKLYLVNEWEIESGVSAFQLFDAAGNILKQHAAEKGNFIRITLPGSGKSDWVKIIDVHDAADEVVITVKPSPDPTANGSGAESATSHFFSSDATNNFCLQKKDATLNFCVIGLHEKPNVAETNSTTEAARNLATAGFGWLGFQKIEWKTFCENFLQVEE